MHSQRQKTWKGAYRLYHRALHIYTQCSTNACTHTFVQQELALCLAWLSVTGTQQRKVLLLQGFMYICVNLCAYETVGSYTRFYWLHLSDVILTGPVLYLTFTLKS